MSMLLTEHFTLHELTRSATAARLGLDNSPSPGTVDALRQVCAHILEPVRAAFGLPVQVVSGYRSPAVNRAVHGSTASQHQLGEAVDFEVAGVDNAALAQWVASNCEFDQVILEFYVQGLPDSGWVHASWQDRVPLRRQFLTAETDARGRVVYRPVMVDGR